MSPYGDGFIWVITEEIFRRRRRGGPGVPVQNRHPVPRTRDRMKGCPDPRRGETQCAASPGPRGIWSACPPARPHHLGSTRARSKPVQQSPCPAAQPRIQPPQIRPRPGGVVGNSPPVRAGTGINSGPPPGHPPSSHVGPPTSHQAALYQPRPSSWTRRGAPCGITGLPAARRGPRHPGPHTGFAPTHTGLESRGGGRSGHPGPNNRFPTLTQVLHVKTPAATSAAVYLGRRVRALRGVPLRPVFLDVRGVVPGGRFSSWRPAGPAFARVSVAPAQAGRFPFAPACFLNPRRNPPRVSRPGGVAVPRRAKVPPASGARPCGSLGVGGPELSARSPTRSPAPAGVRDLSGRVQAPMTLLW